MGDVLHGYVTVTQASRLKGCTPQAIRLGIKRGELKGVKLSRVWIVNEKSLEPYSPRKLKPRKKKKKS